MRQGNLYYIRVFCPSTRNGHVSGHDDFFSGHDDPHRPTPSGISGGMMTFEDKVAVVTGASSGIGRATAILLADRGAAVTVMGRRADRLDEVVAEIEKAGGQALAVAGDVSVAADVERAVVKTVSHFGALHHAVNSAGIVGTAVPSAEIPVARWRQVLDINLDGVFYSLKNEIPAILNSGGGAIVNVSSVWADVAGPVADYTAAKHAIRGLTRAAAREYGPRGLRVNEVVPGAVDTEMTRPVADGVATMIERVPLGRIGMDHEIAKAIAFLLSDDASYVNGAHLTVDGGFLA
jgi:NAD(P)-dependent dehydrogenase (short-subunit alcohol dehydrogenase family)